MSLPASRSATSVEGPRNAYRDRSFAPTTSPGSGSIARTATCSLPGRFTVSTDATLSWLAVDQSAQAHPIWSDTRNADPYTPANGVVHDEDVFSLTANVPDGVATASVGQIGHN